MSILSGGILENAPQPPAGNRGLTAQQVQDAITARLRSYITQARIQSLLNEKLDESDFNIEKASLESRDTENRNNINALARQVANLPTDTHLADAIQAVDAKFGGVPLNGPAAGSDIAFINVLNLNKYIPEHNWATVPMFNGTVLRRDPPQFGESITYLSLYDKILIRITRYNGALATAQRLESTDFFVNVSEWDSLKGIPFPDQSTAEDATRRLSIIASTKDNRALVHEFPQVSPNVWRDTLPSAGSPTDDQLRALETAAQEWVSGLRSGKRFIYIGKSSETNPRLLVGMSGTSEDFLIEALGYH